MQKEEMPAWTSLGRMLSQWPSWPAHLFTAIGLWQFLAAVMPKAELPEITFVTIPWWGWLLAALFLYMVSAAKALGETLAKVETRLEKAAEFDKLIASLKDNTHGLLQFNLAIVRFAYLMEARNQLESHIRGVNSSLENVSKGAVGHGGRLDDGDFRRAKDEAKRALASLEKFAVEHQCGEHDLQEHPNYTANQLAPVPDENGVQEKRLMDFRRFNDIRVTSEPKIDAIRRSLDLQILDATRKLHQLGKYG
jgi:hypothetical protein